MTATSDGRRLRTLVLCLTPIGPALSIAGMHQIGVSWTGISISMAIAAATVAVLYFAMKSLVASKNDVPNEPASLRRGVAVGAAMGSAVVLATVLVIVLS